MKFFSWLLNEITNCVLALAFTILFTNSVKSSSDKSTNSPNTPIDTNKNQQKQITERNPQKAGSVQGSIQSKLSINQMVESSVLKLGSSSYRQRQKATIDLIRIGEPALMYLNKLSSMGNPEISRRCDRIIQIIEADLLNQSLLHSPPLRLVLYKDPLTVAITRINRLTGLEFYLDLKQVKNPHRLITLDTGTMPFWQAIDRFLDEAGLCDEASVSKSSFSITKSEQNPYNENGMPVAQGIVRRGPISSRSKLADDNSALHFLKKIVLVDGKVNLPRDNSSQVSIQVLPSQRYNYGIVRGSNQIYIPLRIHWINNTNWISYEGIEISKAIDDENRNLTQLFPHSNIHNNLEGIPFAQLPWQNGGGLQVLADEDNDNSKYLAIISSGLDPRNNTLCLQFRGAPPKHLKEIRGHIWAKMDTPLCPLITVRDLTKLRPNQTFHTK